MVVGFIMVVVVVVVCCKFFGFCCKILVLLLWIWLSFVMGFFWVFGGGGFPMRWLWVPLWWWWWVYCGGGFALIFFGFFGFRFYWRILVLLL